MDWSSSGSNPYDGPSLWGLEEQFKVHQHRWFTSWETAQLDLVQRLNSGSQPLLPGVDRSSMLWGNVVYLVMCALLSMIMSRQKEGFRLKKVIIIYNAICVVLAGYVVVGIALFKWKRPGRFACNALVTDDTGKQMAFIFWVFYAQKYWEFLDTWFYILRRSFRQVTFLHLFHHSSITLVVGTILPFDFSGDMYLPILLNSMVHVLMYSHYLLTACGIKSWWRPYLTSLQITQFVAITAQSYIAYVGGSKCGAPDFAKLILMMYMASMIVLFLNFFIRRYIFQTSTASMSGVIKSIEPKQNQLYGGVVSFDAAGRAVVILPNRISKLPSNQRREYQYQLTALQCSMPNLHVEKEIDIDRLNMAIFTIAGGMPLGRVSWQVQMSIVNEEEVQPQQESVKPKEMKKID